MNEYNNSYGSDNQNDLNSGTFGTGANNYYNQGVYYGAPKRSKRNGKGTARVVVASLLAAVIGAVGGGVSTAMLLNRNTSTVQSGNGSSKLNTSNVNINVDESVGSVAQAVAE